MAAGGYAAGVLAMLAASHQHRLKITPRVSDQAGRIAQAAALPALGLLPWIPAGAVIRLALLSAIAIGCGRAAAYQILRAAHRRGALSEAAVIVGTGRMATELAGPSAATPNSACGWPVSPVSSGPVPAGRCRCRCRFWGPPPACPGSSASTGSGGSS